MLMTMFPELSRITSAAMDAGILDFARSLWRLGGWALIPVGMQMLAQPVSA